MKDNIEEIYFLYVKKHDFVMFCGFFHGFVLKNAFSPRHPGTPGLSKHSEPIMKVPGKHFRGQLVTLRLAEQLAEQLAKLLPRLFGLHQTA